MNRSPQNEGSTTPHGFIATVRTLPRIGQWIALGAVPAGAVGAIVGLIGVGFLRSSADRSVCDDRTWYSRRHRWRSSRTPSRFYLGGGSPDFSDWAGCAEGSPVRPIANLNTARGMNMVPKCPTGPAKWAHEK